MKIDYFYSQFFKPGNVSTDSRNIKPGDIFIALKGDNFNGDKFADSALQKGACVVVVEESSSIQGDKVVKVKDTLLFLQDLARFHRKYRNLQIIGMTGTNGKTTTKELIKNVLSQKYNVQATQGNLNNHIGVPLTLLSVALETDITIVEMGANHGGEIKTLCEIALPQSGIITNIGKAHLEGFGSFDRVIKAKAELYDFIKSNDGKIYYNGSDDIISGLVDSYPNRIAYNSPSSICTGKIISNLPVLTIETIDSHNNKQQITSHLFGQYNLYNILAAVCIGLDYGLNLSEIKRGIESYYPDSFRSQLTKLGSVQLILDCYNANPTSMENALKSFAEYPGKNKVVILGGMKELGVYEKEEHMKIGKLIKELHFDHIILIGPEFSEVFLPNARYFGSLSDLENYLIHADFNSATILIKGSRANKLERLVETFKNKYSE